MRKVSKVSKKVYKDKAGNNMGFTKVQNTIYTFDTKKSGPALSWNPLTGKTKKAGK